MRQRTPQTAGASLQGPAVKLPGKGAARRTVESRRAPHPVPGGHRSRSGRENPPADIVHYNTSRAGMWAKVGGLGSTATRVGPTTAERLQSAASSCACPARVVELGEGPRDARGQPPAAGFPKRGAAAPALDQVLVDGGQSPERCRVAAGGPGTLWSVAGGSADRQVPAGALVDQVGDHLLERRVRPTQRSAAAAIALAALLLDWTRLPGKIDRR